MIYSGHLYYCPRCDVPLTRVEALPKISMVCDRCGLSASHTFPHAVTSSTVSYHFRRLALELRSNFYDRYAICCECRRYVLKSKMSEVWRYGPHLRAYICDDCDPRGWTY